jgi:hypothetical protein
MHLPAQDVVEELERKLRAEEEASRRKAEAELKKVKKRIDLAKKKLKRAEDGTYVSFFLNYGYEDS